MFTNRALAPPKKTPKDKFHTFKLSEQIIDTHSLSSFSNEGLYRVLKLHLKKKRLVEICLTVQKTLKVTRCPFSSCYIVNEATKLMAS